MLSKECNFKTVTAELYREEAVRDVFISGLQSSLIRQRLLENRTPDLFTMFDQAIEPQYNERATLSARSALVFSSPLAAVEEYTLCLKKCTNFETV